MDRAMMLGRCGCIEHSSKNKCGGEARVQQYLGHGLSPSVAVVALGEGRCGWNDDRGDGACAEREAEQGECDELLHGGPLWA